MTCPLYILSLSICYLDHSTPSQTVGQMNGPADLANQTSPLEEAQLQWIWKACWGLAPLRCFALASFCLLVYDLGITFKREVRGYIRTYIHVLINFTWIQFKYFWRSSWSVSKLLYLIVSPESSLVYKWISPHSSNQNRYLVLALSAYVY